MELIKGKKIRRPQPHNRFFFFLYELVYIVVQNYVLRVQFRRFLFQTQSYC